MTKYINTVLTETMDAKFIRPPLIKLIDKPRQTLNPHPNLFWNRNIYDIAQPQPVKENKITNPQNKEKILALSIINS